mmetsp:Transcript_6073/g.8434  ORF Transcript_6073/g.8434 Transcript_6073/m.8434 type:complete len:535 (+) Transcript_6073:172-1776(+)|eukprot:CAMPEP_0184486310 /NCGR_PEP_ID=MMETSP0113_2-20130426/7815_1 /TAXON_ID=91329 /ORGANISM="Norrisiella sphaerica, Strain BC52" /LENGTH=534 /DNA_ID=CAMNT_0026868123 /DNA_START=204 /DNA_END=1808 /DNA_ORIENTATION=+
MSQVKLARLLLTCKSDAGQKRVTLQDVDLDMRIKDFQSLVASKTDVPSSVQGLEVMDRGGLRPAFREINLQPQSNTLHSHGIKSGDSIRVKDLRFESQVTTVRQGKGWEYPPTVKKSGKMERKRMPRDNSCLFHSIAHVTDSESGEDLDRATTMRSLAADIIKSNPDKYDSVFLEMENEDYINVVLDPNQWGGGIELQIFSRHFEMEITAFDCHFLREDIFGQGEGYKKRVYLIYTGDHYDVMEWKDQKGRTQSQFSPKDLLAWQRGRDLIKSLHEEAAKADRCKLQKEWRKEIKKSTRSYIGGSGRSGTNLVQLAEPTDAHRNAAARRKPIVSNTSIRSSVDTKQAAKRLKETKSMASQKRSGTATSTPAFVPPNRTATKHSVESNKVEIKAEKKEKRVRKLGDDAWDCSACTYTNNIVPDRCQVCRTANPSYRPDPHFFPNASAVDIPNPQRIIPGGGGMSQEALRIASIDPAVYQQMQRASIPAWICPQCRVLNHRGTTQCALTDCGYPNPAVAAAPPIRRQQDTDDCLIS